MGQHQLQIDLNLLHQQNQLTDSSNTTSLEAECLIEKIKRKTDFSLFAEGREIRVVKAFLMFSPYFNALLNSNFSENSQNFLHVSIPLTFMKPIMDFLYTGQLLGSKQAFTADFLA